MKKFAGAADNSSDFDETTLLLQCENNDYVKYSGLEIFKFKTDDKIIGYITLMRNNMVPYAILLGEKYTYFLHNRYEVIENAKIQGGTFLNATNKSLDPYDYHVEKCKDAIIKLEHTQIHICWPGVGKDEEIEDDDLVE